jgi:hypothetical protein
VDEGVRAPELTGLRWPAVLQVMYPSKYAVGGVDEMDFAYHHCPIPTLFLLSDAVMYRWL